MEVRQYSFVVLDTPTGIILSRIFNNSISETVIHWVQENKHRIFCCHHCQGIITVSDGTNALSTNTIACRPYSSNNIEVHATYIYCSMDCVNKIQKEAINSAEIITLCNLLYR